MQTSTHLDSRAYSLPSDPVGYIRASRVRVCACSHARLAAAASHARLAARLPGGIAVRTRQLVWQTYPVGPPRGELKLLPRRPRDGRGMGGHHAGFAQRSGYRRGFRSCACKRRGGQQEGDQLSGNAPGVIVIGPGVARRSTARMGQTWAQMGGRAHRGDGASRIALTVCPLLATATPVLADLEPCSSVM